MSDTAHRRGARLGSEGLDDLALLRDVAQAPTVQRVLDAVRELLGMELAYATEFVDGKQVFRVLTGDGESFGVEPGTVMDLDQTYCQRILTGRLPNLIPDVRGEDRAASMPMTKAGVGAFAAVPLRFANGELYGTLCAASRDANSDLGYRELQLLHVFARIVSDQLEREVLERKACDFEVQGAATAALVAAVEARDSYTGLHSREVVGHAYATAVGLGLDEREMRDVSLVALLHDIGKISIPDSILLKPGPLTEGEWEVMRSHAAHGEQLIQGCPGLEHLGSAIRAEHERWDGQGYPDGLKGEEIPLASRITLVCDAFHAMVSDRPYRQALTPSQALEEIRAGIGTQFCPTAAAAFLEAVERPPASLDAGDGLMSAARTVVESRREAVALLAQTGLPTRLDQVRGELLELISSTVGVAGDAPGSPLDQDQQDALLEAANDLGRVAEHLRAGAAARA